MKNPSTDGLSASIPTQGRSRILQPMVLDGVEIPILNRYLLSALVLIGCLLVLLWSRLDLRETRVALGHAQTRYENALKEKQRLELELNLLLSPVAIEQQVSDWGLNSEITVVEIVEAPAP